MKIRSRAAAVAVPMAGLLLLAACGSDSNDSSNDTSAPATTAAATGDSGGSGAAVSLKGICPDTITLLTDWNPEAEHGFLYQLLAPNPTVDTKEVSVTGALVDHNGNDTGVKLKVRSGGPAVGFQTVTSQLYADDRHPARLRLHRRGDPELRQVPDRRDRERLQQEPADDHVGSGDLPRRRRPSPTWARPRPSSATSRARPTWTS